MSKKKNFTTKYIRIYGEREREKKKETQQKETTNYQIKISTYFQNLIFGLLLNYLIEVTLRQ